MAKAATAELQAQMLSALQALAPATDAVPIAPSDTADLDQEASAIACGGNAGTVKLRTAAGKDRTIAIASGQTIALRFKRVFNTGTSATGLSALLSAVALTMTPAPAPTPTPAPTPQPTLSLSSAVTKAEGNSGTTAFTWTLTLNRDGSTAAYPFTWAVTGSGSNPANAADFGGTFPSGSGTFAAGETTKTITLPVSGDTAAEPDETFTLTVTASGLNTVTSTGTISNDDLPTLTLTPTTASVPASAAPGYQLAAIGNVPAGVTPTLTPNDGRFLIGGSAGTGWVVVLGNAAISDGKANINVAAGGANGATLALTITAIGTGTSANRLSFAGTGFRENVTAGRNVSGTTVGPWDLNRTYLFCGADTYFCTGDWDLPNPEFYYNHQTYLAGGGTSFVQDSNYAATFDGFAFEWGGVWRQATPDSTRLDTSVDGKGKWIKMGGVTLPANTKIRLRATYKFDDVAGQTFPRNDYYGVTGGAAQGSTTSMAATLTNNAAYNNSNVAALRPTKMAAKGGDGRPCVLLIGDSKGLGRDGAAAALQISPRLEAGYASLGLDSNVGAKRLPFANFCVSGQNVENFGNPALVGGMLEMIDKLVERNGGLLPYDVLLSQHGTNSIGGSAILNTLIQSYRDMYGLWRTRGGNAPVPIAQLELTAYAAAGTDAFGTLTGQTFRPGGVDQYPNGIRWKLNEAIGGTDGLGDAAATLRNGTNAITWSEAPWRDGAADTGANRDKWPVAPFSSTLAAAWTGSGAFKVVGQFPYKLAVQIQLDSGGWAYGIVSSVQDNGDGTSTVACVWQGGTGAAAQGATIRGVYAGGNGLHESTYAHEIQAAAVVRLKVKMGQGL